MRVIADITHPDFKITIMAMNQKFIIRLEQGNLEQIYKVSEMDVPNLKAVQEILTENFLNSCMATFQIMRKDLHQASEEF